MFSIRGSSSSSLLKSGPSSGLSKNSACSRLERKRAVVGNGARGTDAWTRFKSWRLELLQVPNPFSHRPIMSRSPSAIFTLVTSAHETQEAADNLQFLLSKYGMLLPPTDWAHGVAENLVSEPRYEFRPRLTRP